MKRTIMFLGFALLFCKQPFFAQSIDTSVASAINHAFAPLEKNRIPSGILLDYGLDLIDVSPFNGSLSSPPIHASLFKELYQNMVSSHIRHLGSNYNAMKNPPDVFKKWHDYQKNLMQSNTQTTTHLALIGMFLDYQKIRSNALSQNAIKVINNATQYDDSYVNGIWQNPYETKTIMAFSVPALEIHTPIVKAKFNANQWYSNKQVQKVEIEMQDGTKRYHNITFGQFATATYRTTGIKTWTVRVLTNNGQTFYSRIKVNVTKAQELVAPVVANPNCNLEQRTVLAERAYMGRANTATLQIAYGSDDCQLRNPLIVAEGLDTGLLAEGGRIGDRDISNFFVSILESESFEIQNLTILDSDIDYDIVYINWNQGTDFIQRNAYVLQEVIDWVNQNKVGDAQNVIIGQSMGGVVTRYALRDMEIRGEDHDTSLFVSHDAPHQGAVVPIGVQYMARHLIDRFIRTPLNTYVISPAAGDTSPEEIRNLLDAPATQQLITNYIDSNFNIRSTEAVALQNELQTMGYPRNTRNVALSNGSHCADPQVITPGDRILEINGGAKTGWLTDVLLVTHPLINSAVSSFVSLLALDAGFLLNNLPGKSKLTFDFRATAVPGSGSREVYYGRIRYTKKLLWLVDIKKTITQRSFNSPSGLLPLETYPGGITPDLSEMDSGSMNNVFGSYNYNLSLNTNFNFIPTTSALDVGQGNVTLIPADYNRAYTVNNRPTGSRAIPFANFTSSFNDASINEPHLSFNARNGN